jgi:predicted membrane protein
MEEKIVSTQKKLDQLINEGFYGLIIIQNTIGKIKIVKNEKATINISGDGRVGSVYPEKKKKENKNGGH